jgi:hypothetical protein
MKRLTISILSFLLLGAFVFAQDEVTVEDLDARVTALEERAIYLSGSSTVSWGLSGQIIDNSDNWIGEIPENDLFTDTGDDPLWPFVWTLSAEAVDENGNVIVSAEAEIDMEEEVFDFPEDGEEGNISYVIIEFPNLVPGMVGLKLEDSDTLEIDVHEVSSDTESPRATFEITPMDGLTATVGVVYDSGQTMNWFFDDVDFATFMADMATLTPATLDMAAIVDGLVDNAADSTSWNSANYADIALSLQVAYELAMGDMDSITATLGLIFDTAYFNHVFIGDSEMAGTDPGDVYVEEERGPKVAKNMDITDSDTPEDIQDGNVWGFATVPIGVSVAVDMMGIEANVDFMTRLVNGWDVANPDAGKDLDITDIGAEFGADYEMGEPRAYAMPIYLGVDAAYEMDMGGMTISPNANFKFSSDFYKIGYDDPDDLEAIEYQGDVAGAEFIGRQMSAGGGIDVEGIADMIDVSISGSVGFGFGAGEWDWPFDNAYNAVDWPDDLTKRISELNDLNEDVDKALKDLDFPGGANNLLFVDDFDAYMVEIGLTATPLDALTIENTFSYIHDGLGFYYINDEEDVSGFDGSFLTYNQDPDTDPGLVWLDQIENETTVEYDIMVSDAVGCTLYGEFTFTKLNYFGEQGFFADKWDKDLETFWIWDSEQSTKTTFDYEIGVKVDVDVWSN